MELEFYGKYKVVLFRGDWVDVNSRRGLKEDNGCTLVKFSKLIHTGERLHDDTFVFSSQVKQVFYVDDAIKKDWKLVVATKPKDLYDMGSKPEVEDDDTYTECVPLDNISTNVLDNCIGWARSNSVNDANTAWYVKLTWILYLLICLYLNKYLLQLAFSSQCCFALRLLVTYLKKDAPDEPCVCCILFTTDDKFMHINSFLLATYIVLVPATNHFILFAKF